MREAASTILSLFDAPGGVAFSYLKIEKVRKKDEGLSVSLKSPDLDGPSLKDEGLSVSLKSPDLEGPSLEIVVQCPDSPPTTFRLSSLVVRTFQSSFMRQNF